MNFKLVPEEQLDFIKSEIEQIKKTLDKLSPAQDDSDLMTNEEVTRYLNLSARTLQNYRDKGLIDFIQVGRKIYYEKKVIAAFLESNKTTAWGKVKGGLYEN